MDSNHCMRFYSCNVLETRALLSSLEEVLPVPLVRYDTAGVTAPIVVDLDGDHQYDLVKFGSGGVTILRGQDAIHHQISRRYLLDYQTTNPASADLDLDGDIDIVCSSTGPLTDKYLWVMKNDGAGGLVTSEYILPNQAGRLALGDFDGINGTDVAVVSGTTLVILNNSGDGQLIQQQPISLTTAFSGFCAADVDSDGDFDLVGVVSGTQSIVHVLVNSFGSFSSPITSTAPLLPRANAILTGDFNNDGKSDVVIGSSETNAIDYFVGRGNGRFQTPIHYNWYCSGSLTAADINNDGWHDLVTDEFAVFYNQNGLGFGGARRYYVSGKAAVFDIDSDGWLDVISANNLVQAFAFVRNDRSGQFVAPVLTNVTTFTLAAAELADLDRDGDADLVTAGASEAIVMLNDGQGGYATHQAYAVGKDPYSVRVADFNCDGALDIAAASYATDQVSLLAGVGDGSFVSNVNFPTADAPSKILAGDFDRDGDIDLLTVHTNLNQLCVLTNDGAGAFGLPVTIAAGSRPTGAATGDVDVDGDVDLIVCNRFGSDVHVFGNDGAGGFSLKQAIYMGSNSGPNDVSFVDIDGDGDGDLAVVLQVSVAVKIARNNGQGIFTVSQTAGVPFSPANIASGDLNGDRQLDLVVSSYLSQPINLLTVDSGGAIVQQSLISGVSQSAKLTIGDLDGDENPDLVSAGSGSVTLFFNLLPDWPLPTAAQILSDRLLPTMEVRFNVAVGDSLQISDFAVRSDEGEDVAISGSVVTGSDTVELMFPKQSRDGNYRLRVLRNGILDALGRNPKSDGEFEFYLLAADANRDRKVNTEDFNLLAGSFGQSGKVFSQGNFDYDVLGNVDSLDFTILAGQYGKTLPEPSPAPLVGASALFGSQELSIVDRMEV